MCKGRMYQIFGVTNQRTYVVSRISKFESKIETGPLSPTPLLVLLDIEYIKVHLYSPRVTVSGVVCIYIADCIKCIKPIMF